MAETIVASASEHKTKNGTPEWVRRAVVYHIYPRSFKDTNGDGIGDIAGIIEKLDYLNDGTDASLGIGAVWLSPVYKSPMADFGYDISDFKDIDSIFGDMKTFERLVEEVHNRGMKLIMDFVPNHTSAEHPWFITSRSSKKNPKHDWYIWKDPKPDGSPPNNWLSRFGGPAWEYDEKRKQYYLHTFAVSQPDLNWRNPDVKEEMLITLEFWLAKGVDGFRTDSIYHLLKDDKFRNDPENPNYVLGKDDPYDVLLHIFSEGRPELAEATNGICEVLGKYGDRFMVSEAYLDIPEMNKMYKACYHKVHAPMNFNLISMPWIANIYREFIDEFEKVLLEEDWPNYIIGNHDRSRVATRLGPERIRGAAMLLLTLRGMPFIYYGDELGMEDVRIPPNKVKDPWEKGAPGMGLGRDAERTPMQWNGGANAGFSTAEPWLPVSEAYQKMNVASESDDPRSIFNLYRFLIHFRQQSEALLHGSYRSVDTNNHHVFAFMRESEDEQLFILMNFAPNEQTIDTGIERGSVVCNTFLDRKSGEQVDLKNFTLRPNEGCVIDIS
ncbi:MAG: alpha-amylase [Candidatus Lloydbacteria bacterium CG22_combo_CG10-13_8_21_14_all_47_15]|uniref:Alpha-amylase n=1 Tax=Candidatus Lloydbacteria bacterium CG22_combo_CG10-13_8_21_14_all_47_15 TaxID=1974635 RepID=A0A2H0CWK0_9BACT|nr:MAG: alpha-amylase [Candidatus Lloydbacteria bacterium CG22_combo_CG10-13_8_21_14_all_47_15]